MNTVVIVCPLLTWHIKQHVTSLGQRFFKVRLSCLHAIHRFAIKGLVSSNKLTPSNCSSTFVLMSALSRLLTLI